MTGQNQKFISACVRCRLKSLVLCVWQRSTKTRMKCEISRDTGLPLMLHAAKWLFEEWLTSANYAAPHV